MGQALLLLAVHLRVGAVEVADQRSTKSLAQKLADDFARAGLVDMVKREARVAHAPQIAVGSVGPPAGFIGVDARRASQLEDEFFVISIEPPGDTLHLPGDRPRAD